MKISVVIPNHNNSSLIAKCLNSLINQELNDSLVFEIVVVDDGSTDNSADQINNAFGNFITLIRLPINQGRSSARNIGAQSSDADYLIFIDSDCIPTDASFIQSYLEAIQNGYELIFGQVTTIGDSFWDRLQRSSFKNRLDEFNKGNKWIYTTQNVCIKRSIFIESGGFDLAFDKHGFEDRDLFIKILDNNASCSFQESAIVIHNDTITLANVARKMQNAGKYSANAFFLAHKEHYLKMPYSKIDCQIRPWLGLIDRILWPFISRVSTFNSDWLESRIIPFALRSIMARCIYGLNYLHGTKLSVDTIKNQVIR